MELTTRRGARGRDILPQLSCPSHILFRCLHAPNGVEGVNNFFWLAISFDGSTSFCHLPPLQVVAR